MGDWALKDNSLSGEEMRGFCNIARGFQRMGLEMRANAAHLEGRGIGRVIVDEATKRHDETEMDLTGRILIAMPGMGDPRFAGSVVLLCAHSPEGTMGLIVNKPVHEMAMRDLFEQLGISPEGGSGKAPLFFGGPVETGRGFVLHTDEYHSGLSSLEIGAGFKMTATQDILEDIAAGRGPRASLVALGYSGWGPGQLEAEIAENGWLIGEASEVLIFGTEIEGIWARALKELGIDPLTLSATAGRA